MISRLNKKLLKPIKLTLIQKGHLISKPIFLNKIKKTGRDFQKFQEINTRVTKTNMQRRHTRKQGTI